MTVLSMAGWHAGRRRRRPRRTCLTECDQGNYLEYSMLGIASQGDAAEFCLPTWPRTPLTCPNRGRMGPWRLGPRGLRRPLDLLSRGCFATVGRTDGSAAK